ncbi:MAG: aldehyde dehydrogenase family protein, partial [Cyclobacteriaceae bacterium]|nr:aldehyde dehydrogenase family protein [Cyclobacteriaceae bacterium]
MATATLEQEKAVARPAFKEKYNHFIGGQWVAPASGEYFDNISPIDGKVFTKAARGNKEDIDKALDAAHKAFGAWSKTSAQERARVLLAIAVRMEQNLELLARVETVDNGKAIRETRAADLPLSIDHFRYFAGAIRSDESTMSEHDEYTISINLQEPLGVVGQIIPWNFPLLMASWKIAPALAAGCTVVVKPAEQTPTSIMVLMELIQDILPAGVLNVVTGFGVEAGKPLATSPRVAKVAFTGETTTGRLIMQYASENLIPVTMELGGKSPNIFMPSIADEDDAFFDKCVEGAVMFALNQGEVCTCPSRILVHDSIYDRFMERVIKRTQAIKVGNPLASDTMMGAQASNDQYEKILSYMKIGKDEGAQVLTGGGPANLNSGLEHGYYIQPTIFKG